MTAPSTPKDPKHAGIGRSIVDGVEQAVSTVANAASVAATGSELGVLELAVEDDLGLRKSPARKAKPTARKRPARKTTRAAPKRKRAVKAKRSKKPARKPAKSVAKKKAAKTARDVKRRARR
jgi:hypothetical protein